MNRFHFVVGSWRAHLFVESFHKVKGFDKATDSIYFFEASPEWGKGLAAVDKLTKFGLEWGKNLFFIRRSNWGGTLGSLILYYQCVRDGRIPKADVIMSVQDHFFDTERHVKEDTIPEDAIFDLDKICDKFKSDPQVGCVYFARYGIRVCATNPRLDPLGARGGDGEILVPGARRKCFTIDGENFIVRPELFFKWFDKHPRQIRPNNGWAFNMVWETRLGQILYDQRIKWVDMYRDLEFTTVADLDVIEARLGHRVSKLWYDNRVYFFFCGRDIEKYWPRPFLLIVKYFLQFYWRELLDCPRDSTLVFITPGTIHLAGQNIDNEAKPITRTARFVKATRNAWKQGKIRFLLQWYAARLGQWVKFRLRLGRHGAENRQSLPCDEEYGFIGNYAMWAEAVSASKGYSSANILKKVRASSLAVRNGQAAFERDSVAFDCIQYSWPMLSGLMWVAAQSGGELNVLDFGGSLGSLYFQNRPFLESLRLVTWSVVEQPHYVEVGKREFADGTLAFYHSLDECLKQSGKTPTVVVLSSVLPYLERPYALLSELLDHRIPYMIVDRTQYWNEPGDRLCVQKVPPHIFEASYPTWIFSMSKFKSFFAGHRIVAEWNGYEKVSGVDHFGCIIQTNMESKR